MDEGEGNDPMDQFHGNEAISAVADDGFMGEDDEDYDDLYNDVNVGEGFLQSMRGKSDVVSGPAAVDDEDDDNQIDDPSPPPPLPPPPPSQPPKEAQSSIPGVGGGSGEGSGGGDGGARYGQTQNLGFRGNEIGAKPAMRVELGPVPLSGGVQDQQPILHQPPPPLPLPPPPMPIPASHGGAGGSGTVLFVGDLHWWTTDAELESELCKYGQVKEVKFFDEKASGKSKGYCQVEFFDPAAATACKESMNGHHFNGRPCVVAYASPFNVKRMGEAQVNRAAQNQVSSTGGLTTQNQPLPGSTRPGPVQQPLRRGLPDNNINSNNNNNPVSKPALVGNYPVGNGENNNNRGGFGRGGWARGNGNRVGPVGQIRGRGLSGRGVIGNGFGPVGPNPMIHPQAAMMGHHHHHQGGFDPGFGRAAYGAFPGGPVGPPFSGILSTFPPGVGLPGVAPHVNPAFFGRGGGMGMNGMGMMPGSAGVVDGPPGMMWADPGMAPWGSGNGNGNGNGDDQEAASDHQYTDDRGAWPNNNNNNNNNNMKEKERGGSERDWSGSSDRRYRDENRDPPAREKEAAAAGDPPAARERRDRDRDRDRERERERSRDRERDRDHHHRDHRDHRERDRHREDREYHRYKDRESEHHHEEEWDRGRGSSRAHQGNNKSRAHNQDDNHHHRSRSREADYGKRRRLTSE